MNATVAHAWRTIMSARDTIHAVLLLFLGFCAGASVGIASAFLYRSDSLPFELHELAPAIPTVIIEAAPAGTVEGRLEGDARLLLGNDLVASGSGSFRGIMQGSLPRVVEVLVPPGMKYVASKTGKKYYDVTSAMGNRLLPKNRVYFPDRASAEAAGFKR